MNFVSKISDDFFILKGMLSMQLSVRITLLFTLFLLSQSAFAQVDSIGPSTAELLSLSQKTSHLPQTGAVVLSRRGNVVVDNKGFETSQYYNAIYITGEEALKDYTKLTSSFNSYYQDKVVEFARIITPEGKVLNMQDDAISLAAANSSDDYFDEMKQYEFALPQLKKGSIIEYQVKETQIKDYIKGEWFSNIDFYFVKFLPSRNWLRIDPVLQTQNKVVLPKSLQLHYVNQHLDLQPRVSSDKNHRTYLWENNNLPGIVIETEMPSLFELMPSIRMSTMKSWDKVNAWFNELYLPTQQKNEKVSALAKKLFQGLNSDKDKVKAVFNYMQNNVRYIGAHVNRGGYQPHLASEVLAQAYGDCKDQAVLITALLKEAKITAHPAMINSYPGAPFDDNLATLNFNHMITYVELADEKIWLDTSGDTGAFPGIYAGLEGKTAFVVNGNKGLAAKLPLSTADDNVAHVIVDFSFENKKLNAEVSLSMQGQIETNLRNYIQFSPEKITAIEQIFSPLVFNNRVSDYKMSSPSDIAIPFTLSATFSSLLELTDEIDNFRYAFDYSSLLKVFTSLSNLPPISTRQQAFDITLPMKVIIEMRYHQPWQGAKIALSEPAKDIQNEFFEISHQVIPAEERAETISTFTLHKQTVSVANYPVLFKHVEQFSQNSQSLLVYQKHSKEDSKTAKGEISVAEKLLQAKALLESAKFDEALVVAKEITTADVKNAEGFYLLGLAYGFNGDDTLSEQAFFKAEQLGYKL